MSVGQLVIIRHGQSEANAKDVFAGWVDTGLTDTGKQQAHSVGDILRKDDFKPDVVFASTLTRAIDTAKIALTAMDMPTKEIVQAPALLERHYGGLTGMNKAKAAEEFGPDQFFKYRRSFNEPPPPMDEAHPAHPDHPGKGEKVIGLPSNGKGTESLEDVVQRVKPFFNKEILPRMKRGEKVMIAAHGNSLRALSMIIESMTPEAVSTYEIANGAPIKYTLNVPARGPWSFQREMMTGKGADKAAG